VEKTGGFMQVALDKDHSAGGNRKEQARCKLDAALAMF